MEALPPARRVLGRGRGAGSLPALFASGVTAGRAGWVGDGPVGLGLGGQLRWLQVEEALAPLPTSQLSLLLSPAAQLWSSVFAGVCLTASSPGQLSKARKEDKPRTTDHSHFPPFLNM